MDVTNSSTIGGSLQISTDVIAKIAKLATLEIEGVKEVSTGTMGVKSLFNKVNLQKPILVQLTDDVAEITVNIMVRYGYKIPQLCEKVQENVKSSVGSVPHLWAGLAGQYHGRHSNPCDRRAHYPAGAVSGKGSFPARGCIRG